MKRLRHLLILVALCSVSAGADTTASAGGGVTFDSTTAARVTPTVVSTLAGDLTWLPTDSLGAFLDWSAGGNYEPLTGSASAVASLTASSSYLSGKFLGRLSVASAASLSTMDPFYGAVSPELLFSYGGPVLSVFAAPRFTFVDDSGIAMDLGGRAGIAFLVADRLLVKPWFEAGISVPGGPASGWYVIPSVSLSWYAGGGFSLDVTGGCRASYSVRLTPLTSGGPALPLDTYRRGFLSVEASWAGTKGTTLSAGLPIAFTGKTYDAYDGGVNLGGPGMAPRPPTHHSAGAPRLGIRRPPLHCRRNLRLFEQLGGTGHRAFGYHTASTQARLGGALARGSSGKSAPMPCKPLRKPKMRISPFPLDFFGRWIYAVQVAGRSTWGYPRIWPQRVVPVYRGT